VEDAGECKEGVLEVARRVGSRAIGADEGLEGLSWVVWLQTIQASLVEVFFR
jgi:hypothetical protein